MRSSQESYEEAKGYQISHEPVLPLLPDGLTQDDIERCHSAAFEGDKAALHEVKRMVAKYPEVPCLWNYLAAGYHIRKEPKKARRVERQLLKQHPDYFFAKIAEAKARCQTDKAESVPEVLGESLTLRETLGHERAPHISEWRFFYHTLAHWYLKTGHLDHVAKLAQALHEEPEAREAANELETTLRFARLAQWQESLAKASRQRIKVDQGVIPKLKERLPRPDDLPPEVAELYQYGIEIPQSKIEAILALPRETSIPALRQVVRNSVANGPHFYHFEGEEDEGKIDFGLHAIFLLSELRAVEARPEVFAFLGQHEEILTEAFGDYISWQPLTGFVDDNLAEITTWLTSPGLSYLGRSYLTEALATAGLNWPELREPVLNVFRQVLEVLRDGTAGDGVLDTNLVSSMLGDLLDLRAIECKDLFCELYERDLVDGSMIGTLEMALTELEAPLDNPRPLVSMAKFYRNLTTPRRNQIPPRQGQPFPNLNDPLDLTAPKGLDLLSKSSTTSGLEPGRNDPCPCGSGRKYKKCCMSI